MNPYYDKTATKETTEKVKPAKPGRNWPTDSWTAHSVEVSTIWTQSPDQ